MRTLMFHLQPSIRRRGDRAFLHYGASSLTPTSSPPSWSSDISGKFILVCVCPLILSSLWLKDLNPQDYIGLMALTSIKFRIRNYLTIFVVAPINPIGFASNGQISNFTQETFIRFASHYRDPRWKMDFRIVCTEF